MLMVAVICMGAAIALGLYAVLSQAEEKAVVRSSLRQLDDYEVESVREKELLAPDLRARARTVHGRADRPGQAVHARRATSTRCA